MNREYRALGPVMLIGILGLGIAIAITAVVLTMSLLGFRAATSM